MYVVVIFGLYRGLGFGVLGYQGYIGLYRGHIGMIEKKKWKLLSSVSGFLWHF